MSRGGSNDGRVGVCATCGRSITHPGPNGECAHCLVGFLSEDNSPEREGDSDRAAPRSLQYAHFEVEVDKNGLPTGLGAGAAAITYRARDTILNSRVALKVISRKLAENPTAHARFLREARAAAQINHPNVARVIHYGEQDGECFYAMELVHGETLEARVKRSGPLPLSVALEVMEQTARGLAAGEACGVVHRDLKPSNLMIESDPSGQILIKIIDYGVAKMMAPDATIQTQAGFIGTPSFASPEQFDEVGHQQIDTRSDIFALGVTFWYLITGSTPFTGRSIEDIRARQNRRLPLEQLKSIKAPQRIITLLKSMLAVDPAKRPQTALELLAAVHHCFLRFEPAARRRRKRLVLAGGALLVGIALAGLATFIHESAQSSSDMNRSIAVLPFETLSSNPDDQFFTMGIQDEILTRLSSLADIKVISRTSTEKYKSNPTDLKTVGQQLGVGRILEGSVQRAAGKVRVNVQLIDPRTDAHLWANTYDQLLDDSFAVETEIANAVAQQLDSKLVQRISGDRPTSNAAAYDAYLRGVAIERQGKDSVFQGSATAYEEAVRLDPEFALAWARLSLARSFLFTQNIEPNANSPTAIKEAADRAISLRPNLGEALVAQGAYHARVLHDFTGALQAYRAAQKYLPNSSLLEEYMCAAETTLAHWKEAETHFVRATELDPRNVRLLTKTSQKVYGPTNQFDAIAAAIDRALEIVPNDEETLAEKASTLQDLGRLKEAGQLLESLSKDTTNPYVLQLRAWQAMYERRFDVALFWAEKTAKSLKPSQLPSFLNLWLTVHQGYFHEWAGHPEEARASFEKVIHAIVPTTGSVIPSGRETRSILALAYAGVGDKQNALEQAGQAVADFDRDAYVKPSAERYLAIIQARFGDLDGAITNVSRLLQTPHGIGVTNLRYSPFWDPLRKDPRFEALLRNPPTVRY